MPNGLYLCMWHPRQLIFYHHRFPSLPPYRKSILTPTVRPPSSPHIHLYSNYDISRCSAVLQPSSSSLAQSAFLPPLSPSLPPVPITGGSQTPRTCIGAYSALLWVLGLGLNSRLSDSWTCGATYVRLFFLPCEEAFFLTLGLDSLMGSLEWRM